MTRHGTARQYFRPRPIGPNVVGTMYRLIAEQALQTQQPRRVQPQDAGLQIIVQAPVVEDGDAFG